MNSRSGSAALWICLFVALGDVTFAADPKQWTYPALADASDLVVIAVPKGTMTSTPTVAVPDAGAQPVLRTTTNFDVLCVPKGDKQTAALTVLHYTPAGWENPDCIAFSTNMREEYLLFLKAGDDGLYAPASGQMNPKASVKRLDGGIPVLPRPKPPS